MAVSFQLHQKIFIDNTEYEIFKRERIGDEIRITLVDVKKKEIRIEREAALIDLLVNKSINVESTKPGSIYEDCDLNVLEEYLQDEAKRRELYVLTYLDITNELNEKKSSKMRKKAIGIVASQLNDRNVPSQITLYRWEDVYTKSGGNFRVLAPKTKFQGGKKSRIHPEVQAIVIKAINEVYMNEQRESVQTVCDRVNALVLLENKKRTADDQLISPHRATVHRIVNKMYLEDAYGVDLARYGKRYADQKHKSYKRGVRPTRPLERVEVDSTKIDVIIIDEETGKIIGRAYLTILICCYSKQILGYFISFEPLSYLTLAECLKHAMFPKDYIKDKFPNIKESWHAYGIPEVIVCDNGADYISNSFRDSCRAMGIDIMHMPPRTPWWKPTVERLFRSANNKVFHRIPGTTFSNFIEKDEYKSESFAIMSLEKMEEILHHWIVDIYQMEFHRGINGRPRDKWLDGIKDFPPRMPESLEKVLPLLGSMEERVIQRKGVELDGLIYDCDELRKLRVRFKKGEKVLVKYRPSDLSMIWVYEDSSINPIPVPAIDQDYTKGLTKWLHQLNKKVAAEKFGEVNPENLILAKNYLWELINDYRINPKTKKIGPRNARAAKIGIDNINPMMNQDPMAISKETQAAVREEENTDKEYGVTTTKVRKRKI